MCYRGCWHIVSRGLFLGYRPFSSPRKGFYDPRAFITHAALLRLAFAHCAIFLTAASRRSLARVSVPVWGVTLSRPLPVFALVGHYPTNKLMGRKPLPKRRSIYSAKSPRPLGISCRFQQLSPSSRQVTYVLLTRSPLSPPDESRGSRSTCMC